MRLKLASTDLPRLVRRFERTALYISKKRSSIAYYTGMYYLDQLREAIESQRFPQNYKPLSDNTIKYKTLHTPNNAYKFWIMYGDLLRAVVAAKPKLEANTRNKTTYVLSFDGETSKKIYYNDKIRPLFAPLYHEMRERIKKEGRKALMDAVREGMRS